MEDALYDNQALRAFAGIDLAAGAVPDATTLLGFRHLLERHGITKRLLEEVGAMLVERGVLLREGTMVDATIIAAPSSTKNVGHRRDPEMDQTKKGNVWHFGLKAHVGANVASGLVHSLAVTAANVADVVCTTSLLTGKNKVSSATRDTSGHKDGWQTSTGNCTSRSRSSVASSRRCRRSRSSCSRRNWKNLRHGYAPE